MADQLFDAIPSKTVGLVWTFYWFLHILESQNETSSVHLRFLDIVVPVLELSPGSHKMSLFEKIKNPPREDGPTTANYSQLQLHQVDVPSETKETLS